MRQKRITDLNIIKTINYKTFNGGCHYMPYPYHQSYYVTPTRAPVSASSILIAAVILFITIPSQLALNHPWQPVIPTAIGAYVILLATFAFQLKRFTFTAPRAVLLIWAGMLLAATISLWTTGSGRALMVYGSLFSIFLTTAIIAQRCTHAENLVLTIVIGASLSGVVIALIGIAIEPFSLKRYQGLFNNPNSMGWFSAGLFHLTAGALYGYGRQIYSRTRWFLLVALGLFLTLLLASNSRAALGSVLSVTAVLILLRLTDAINIRRMTLHRQAFSSAIILLISAVIVGLLSLALGWLDEIIEKFVITLDRGNLTQSRAQGWIASLQHWTWFGLGPDYAAAIGREDLTTGHSTWISHLSRYGAVGAALFIGLLTYICVWAWKCALTQRAPEAFVLLTCIVGFLANATFETGTSSPGLLLSLIFFAIVIQSKAQKNLTERTPM